MSFFSDERFKETDASYFEYIDKLLEMPIDKREIIYNFPCFVGMVNIARSLGLYELYKQTIPLSGHVADLGTYKGASFLLLAKLVKLLEPYSQTQAHAFDWFQGMNPSADDDLAQQGKYIGDYETLCELVKLQDLSDICVIHKMDLVNEPEAFFQQNPSLRFKLIFLDCGIAEVLDSSMQHFWPRLVKGGILVLDHYNHECSPSESRLMEKHVGDRQILQIPYCRQPTGYVVK